MSSRDDPQHACYVLTRHADVVAAAVDTASYSSAQGLTEAYGDLEQIGMTDDPPMVMLDHPDTRSVGRGMERLMSTNFWALA
ncbi:MAG: hypothetical protein WB471_10485 [Nocardioides sp.]